MTGVNGKLPVVKTRFGVIGLFLTGAVAIGLGMLDHYWETGQSPASAESGGASVTTTQPELPTGPSVDYQAPVTLDRNNIDTELDLDINPLRRIEGYNANRTYRDMLRNAD